MTMGGALNWSTRPMAVEEPLKVDARARHTGLFSLVLHRFLLALGRVMLVHHDQSFTLITWVIITACVC
jgi:hypothetical protein